MLLSELDAEARRSSPPNVIDSCGALALRQEGGHEGAVFSIYKVGVRLSESCRVGAYITASSASRWLQFRFGANLLPALSAKAVQSITPRL